jgi:hypothetical protein
MGFKACPAYTNTYLHPLFFQRLSSPPLPGDTEASSALPSSTMPSLDAVSASPLAPFPPFGPGQHGFRDVHFAVKALLNSKTGEGGSEGGRKILMLNFGLCGPHIAFA